MLPEGSKLFWTHQRIEEFIARTAGESAKKPPSRPGEATDLSAYILELGRHNGFTADEVRQEIGKWMEVARKDVTDFHRQGMVAFAEKNFRLAGENFRRSAEEDGAAGRRRSPRERRPIASSPATRSTTRGIIARPSQQYRHALTLLNTYKDSLGPLGIRTYPEHTVDVRRITLKSANAKRGLGEQVAGPDSRRHLEEAVREYLGLIAQVPRSSDPRQWATTQNNLGAVALEGPGPAVGRSGGSAAAERGGGGLPPGPRPSAPATTCPQDWAQDPEQPGHRALGPGRAIQGGPEGLRQAETRRWSLPPGPHRPHPRRPAPGLGQTQNNLGSRAPAALGERLGGPEGLAVG